MRSYTSEIIMKRRGFNMIEILLALGVIAIGAVSVLALFPYGFSANRDSIAESFAGDSADQFLHWFAAQARADWDTYAGDPAWLPTSKPAVPDTAPFMETDDWGTAQEMTENLTYERHSSDNGLLRVTFQRGEATEKIVDFSGVYRVWYDSVTVPYLTGAGATEETTLSTDIAVGVNLEASWPGMLPYNRRQKKTYRLEVFRPTPDS